MPSAPIRSTSVFALSIHGRDVELFGVPSFFCEKHDGKTGGKKENEYAKGAQLFGCRYIEKGRDRGCGEKPQNGGKYGKGERQKALPNFVFCGQSDAHFLSGLYIEAFRICHSDVQCARFAVCVTGCARAAVFRRRYGNGIRIR